MSGHRYNYLSQDETEQYDKARKTIIRMQKKATKRADDAYPKYINPIAWTWRACFTFIPIVLVIILWQSDTTIFNFLHRLGRIVDTKHSIPKVKLFIWIPLITTILLIGPSFEYSNTKSYVVGALNIFTITCIIIACLVMAILYSAIYDDKSHKYNWNSPKWQKFLYHSRIIVYSCCSLITIKFFVSVLSETEFGESLTVFQWGPESLSSSHYSSSSDEE